MSSRRSVMTGRSTPSSSVAGDTDTLDTFRSCASSLSWDGDGDFVADVHVQAAPVKSADMQPSKGVQCFQHTFANGDTYDGEWLDGYMHGQGTYEYAATGNKYEGNWHHGQKSGVGTYRSKDGKVFHGIWAQNLRHGQGTVTDTAGNRLECEWSRGVMHGPGTYHYPSGSTLRGTWHNYELVGEGIYTDNANKRSAPVTATGKLGRDLNVTPVQPTTA